MRFLFPVPDYSPVLTAAIWLASGSVVATAIWAGAAIYVTYLKTHSVNNHSQSRKEDAYGKDTPGDTDCVASASADPQISS